MMTGDMFANVQEHPEPVPASVQGTIPSWLKGTFLKNGPGMFNIGPDRYNHWFDGLALLQRFAIENGQVLCSTKYLRSETYKTNMAAQRIVVSEFGTLGCPDPCKSLFSRYFSYFFPQKFTDNDLVNFIQCGDEIYTATETNMLNRIDSKTLDTLQQVDMGKYVAVNTLTAHPHYDREGNVYNLGNSIKTYQIVRISKPLKSPGDIDRADGAMARTSILASIPSQSYNMSYYHSFGITENYILFPEMPIVLNVVKLLSSALRGITFNKAMEWHPERQTEVHVVNLNTGQKVEQRYVANPFFVFHHVNAFESDGFVVMDVCAYNDASVMDSLELSHLDPNKPRRASSKSVIKRFVLPLIVPENAICGVNLLTPVKDKLLTKAEAVLQTDSSIFLKPETIIDSDVELPRINYAANNGRAYRFCYAVGADDATAFANKIVKCDVVAKKVVGTWKCDHARQYAGEPVFVPRPDATDHDDGVLLACVSDFSKPESDFLLVLDAQTLSELARAVCRPRLPLGIHGHFIAE